MTFGKSVSTVFAKYAEFTGVASRSEFWWFVLFSAIVSSALGAFNGLTPDGSTVAVGSTLSTIWSIGVLVPSLAVTVRRLRDAGRQWQEVFWILLPIAGAIILIIHLAEPSKTTAVPATLAG